MFTHDPEQDLVSRLMHDTGQWEPFETHLWLACLRQGCTVVDVGANLGYFSLLSALHAPSAGRIVAVEPAADNAALLRANLKFHDCIGRVNIVQAAWGDREESGALFRNEANRGDHQIYPGDGERTEEMIAVASGIASLAEFGVHHIDLLKVDTQGSEHAVITGLMPVLKRSGSKLRIVIELTPWSLRCAGTSGAMLLVLLDQLSLPVFIVDHIAHKLVPTDIAALTQWCDNVDAEKDDRGFMNIFLGTPPDGF